MSEPDFSQSKMPQFKSSRRLVLDHPELHHYTDAEGLKGIWNSRTIWATHFSHLSDKSEIHVLRKPMETLLKNKFNKLIQEQMSKDLTFRREIENYRSSVFYAEQTAKNFISAHYDVSFLQSGLAMAEPFITSFCSHSNDNAYERDNGLLSQWRGYSGKGKYALVFDTSRLCRLLESEWHSYHWVKIEIGEVFYYFDQNTILDKFPDLIDVSLSEMTSVLNGGGLSDEVFKTFSSAATLLKHRGFEEEREIRIVAIPLKRRDFKKQIAIKDMTGYPPLKKVHYGENNRRYLALFESFQEPLPITRIIVGPSQNQEGDEAFVHDLTKGSVKITLSETPYIGP